MAVISHFQRGSQSIGVHTTEVVCYHQVIYGVDSEKVVHLSTFGSAARAIAGKSSQSIQLKRDAAADLVTILRAEFPGI